MSEDFGNATNRHDARERAFHLLYETETRTHGYPAIDRYVANKMLWAYARALTLKA